MPIYNYKCEDCHKEFEIEATIEQKIANDPAVFACADCGSANISQNFSLESLIKKAEEESSFGKTCPVTYGDKANNADGSDQSGGCTPGGGCCA